MIKKPNVYRRFIRLLFEVRIVKQLKPAEGESERHLKGDSAQWQQTHRGHRVFADGRHVRHQLTTTPGASPRSAPRSEPVPPGTRSGRPVHSPASLSLAGYPTARRLSP